MRPSGHTCSWTGVHARDVRSTAKKARINFDDVRVLGRPLMAQGCCGERWPSTKHGFRRQVGKECWRVWRVSRQRLPCTFKTTRLRSVFLESPVLSLVADFGGARNRAVHLQKISKKFNFLPRHAVLRGQLLMQSPPPLRLLALHVWPFFFSPPSHGSSL